uniref:Uncharacterized protein n=1 Tax=Astyanax mexicanus TaxID=7994 RepID=A0A3B1IYD2_ASTMX
STEFSTVLFANKRFFSDIKKNILTSPLRTSVPFSLIILGLEKVADLEFSCPCNPKVNTLFAAFMFIGPALFALTIIVYVTNPCKHGWRCSCGCTYIRNLLSCLIPPAVWVLFNGLFLFFQIAGLIALAVSSGLAMIVYCCTCSGQEAAENSQPPPQRATEMLRYFLTFKSVTIMKEILVFL